MSRLGLRARLALALVAVALLAIGVATLILDLIYPLLDPRISYSRN